MEEINKTNEQLHEEFEEALQILSEKLYALLHFGSYTLEYIDRDYKTQAVRWATMNVDKHKLILKSTDWDKLNPKGSEVTIRFPDNPVSKELLEFWDKQTIQRDIDYHKEKLNDLLKRKEELSQ